MDVDLRNLRNHLFESDPNYFEQAKVWNASAENYSPAASYSLHPPVHHFKQRTGEHTWLNVIFEPHVKWVSWHGKDVKVAVWHPDSVPLMNGQRWLTVILDKRAILVNQELNSVILCRDSHVSLDLKKFFKDLPGRISELADTLRQFTAEHLNCEIPLTYSEFHRPI